MPNKMNDKNRPKKPNPNQKPKAPKLNINFFKGDLPAGFKLRGDLAIDTETKGLNIYLRDRLCLVQIADEDGKIVLVQLEREDYKKATNLKKLLEDDSRVKIFHFARFDVAALKIYLGADLKNVYCTKIASKLARTYTDRHGLKDLVRELLGVELSKQQQSSDWSQKDLSEAQMEYAASDVIYLHAMKTKLNMMLEAEKRTKLAKKCFDFIPARAELDILGWEQIDIFAHS
jgi:ribonuclease D